MFAVALVIEQDFRGEVPDVHQPVSPGAKRLDSLGRSAECVGELVVG